jgi:hypothetical protein
MRRRLVVFRLLGYEFGVDVDNNSDVVQFISDVVQKIGEFQK